MRNPSRWLIHFFDNLFPETKVAVSQWALVFWDKDRSKFRKAVGVLSSLCAFAYILHFHFVDIPQGKTPIEKWFMYRYGMAAVSIGIFLVYKFNLVKRYLRTPYFLVCILFCFLQGQTLIWHPGTPYQYGFVMAFIMAWSLQVSTIKSLFAFMILLGSQWNAMLISEVPFPHMISNFILFAVSLIFTRQSYKLEIDSFLNDMELTASQQKNIEQSIEFSNHLLAFLPRMIGLRLKTLMAREGLPIAAAADIVMKARTVPVACVYSDIRGFTKKSRNLEFISRSALNEIQSLSLIVDESYGIPRKIGDLMFAYFDSGDLIENVLRSSVCSISMYEKNKELNEFNLDSNKVERRYILTSGIGVVGNLGTSSSSIEITAMGPSVNLAARIDELSKNPKLVTAIQDNHIICSTEFGALLKSYAHGLKMYSIDLSELNVTIRDFPDETRVWLLEASPENKALLSEILSTHSNENDLRRSLSNLEAS